VTGGVEAILGAHARLLRKAGHDVRLVAGRGDCSLVPELDSRHPQVEKLTGELAAGRFDEATFERLETKLARTLGPLLEDRDLVVAHNMLTMPFNLPAAAALVAAGRPLLAWTHDLAWVNPRYKAFRRRGRPWSILHEPQSHTRYVAISRLRQGEICETLGLPRRAVPVVPNGIDEMGFLGVGLSARRLLRRAGLEHADPLVLVPLRITPRKRLELAVEAAAVLRARFPRAGLLVTGPLGPHSPENRAYAQSLLELRASLRLDDVVAFCFEHAKDRHPVSDADMAHLYRCADVVLLPSESEGFGLPVLEGGLARAPVVCTELDVLREVGGSAIWTFPARAGGAEIAATVASALRSRNARLRRRVRSEYTWTSVMKRIEQIL
jgi:glycosyltransferase involved in cell wall biosynthesis